MEMNTEVWNYIGNQIINQVCASVRNKIIDNAWVQFSNLVRIQVESPIRIQVRDQISNRSR